MLVLSLIHGTLIQGNGSDGYNLSHSRPNDSVIIQSEFHFRQSLQMTTFSLTELLDHLLLSSSDARVNFFKF